jgi:hypothetical protein
LFGYRIIPAFLKSLRQYTPIQPVTPPRVVFHHRCIANQKQIKSVYICKISVGISSVFHLAVFLAWYLIKGLSYRLGPAVQRVRTLTVVRSQFVFDFDLEHLRVGQDFISNLNFMLCLYLSLFLFVYVSFRFLCTAAPRVHPAEQMAWNNIDISSSFTSRRVASRSKNTNISRKRH